VEITTYVAMGDLAGVAPVVDLPPRWQDPVVKNLMMLLFERFEQRYRARDLVDAALMLEALDSYPVLWREIDRLGLWPEYTELVDLVERTELIAVPHHGRSRTLSVAGTRARRAGRRLAALRRPTDAGVRHLQQRLVFDQRGRTPPHGRASAAGGAPVLRPPGARRAAGRGPRRRAPAG